MNDREHWRVKAQRVAEVREAVAYLARAEGIPQLDRPRVTLHYSPRDKRRRDAENCVPTSKAAVDGLVRAGVLVDDDAEHFTPTMPVIEQPNGQRGRLWLVIEERCGRCGGTGDPTDDDEEHVELTCRRCYGAGWM
jgi:crossover junction endodeoxyribonuclease RusA